MYIRTKDGRIAEVKENMAIKRCSENVLRLVYKDNRSICVLSGNDDITKEAHTIEELCDEFVYIKDGIASQYLTIDFKFKRDDEFCALKNRLTANGIAEISKGISKYELQVGELKGAIWTDKGLIYVAKMDSDGKLELI